MALDLAELKNLDPKDPGNWPWLAKGGAMVLLVLAVLGGGYWFDTQHQRVELAKVQKKEGDLKAEFEKKQAKAVNLDTYKRQMEEMHETFGTMLRQLPGKTEVADLLVDITQTGLASGLEFNLFKPGAEVKREFYAELPITLEVKGTYHELGTFVSGVAALPRIVTIHNISVGNDGGKLKMSATAKTYRYLEDAEMGGSK